MTSESASRIIVRVAVRAGTRILEVLRIRAGLTHIRRRVGPTTAILWGPKCITRALTRDPLLALPHHDALTHHPQLGRARSV